MKTTLILLCSAFTFQVLAQGNLDVANEQLAGDARYTSLVGSMSALGGNFSGISQNPAGLSFFDKNEVAISPFLKRMETQAIVLDNLTSDEKWKNAIGDVHLILNLDRYLRGKSSSMKSKWSNLNLAVGQQRANDFHYRLLAEGWNPENSILNSAIETVNFGEGVTPERLAPLNRLFFETMLIDSNPRYFAYDSISYFSLVGGKERQSLAIDRTGYAKTIVFAFAATYGEKVSIGIAVNHSNVFRNEDLVYGESDPNGDSIPLFRSFILQKNLKTFGKGIGMKAGVVYKAAPWLRLGIAYHTPMFLNLTDVSNMNLKSEFDDRKREAEAPEEILTYQMATPAKTIISVAAVNKANTFAMNVDYESVNYRSMRVRAIPEVAFDANREIQTTLKPTANLRVGLEGRVKKMVALRFGVGFFGNPLAGNPFLQLNPNNLVANLAAFERTTLGFGVGLHDMIKAKRSQKSKVSHFVEIGYSVSNINNPTFNLYQLKDGSAPAVVSRSTLNQVVATFGVRF